MPPPLPLPLALTFIPLSSPFSFFLYFFPPASINPLASLLSLFLLSSPTPLTDRSADMLSTLSLRNVLPEMRIFMKGRVSQDFSLFLSSRSL
jgi:hypothetical protein